MVIGSKKGLLSFSNKINSLMLIALMMALILNPISLKASLNLSLNDDLIIDKNQVIVFEESPIIQTRNILIKDNGTLIIKYATLQLSIRGEKAYNITVEDNGKLILQSGTILSLNKGSKIFLKNFANLTMVDGSVIEGFYAIMLDGNSTFTIENSELKIDLVSGNCKSFKALSSSMENGLISINASFIDFIEFIGDAVNINGTFISLSFFNSKSLNSFSKNETKAINIKSGNSLIYSEKKLLIKDSSFSKLIAGKTGELYNVTTLGGALTKAGGEVYVYQNSTLFRYWYLKVEVFDIIKAKIPAKIIIYDLNKTIVQEEKADFEGKFEKPILAEIINITKSNFVGNYKIQAIYENYSTPIEPLIMDSNKNISLIFDEPIPFATAVFIEVSSNKIKLGDSITISGKINPSIENALIEITYIKPDGSKVLRAKTTNLNGSFNDSIQPDSIGEWKVYATWITTNETLLKNRSRISKNIVFIVEPKPKLMNLLLSLFPIITALIAIIIGIAALIIQKRRRI